MQVAVDGMLFQCLRGLRIEEEYYYIKANYYRGQVKLDKAVKNGRLVAYIYAYEKARK